MVENRWAKREKEGAGRIVRLEGDVKITSYLGEDEQGIEDRIA